MPLTLWLLFATQVCAGVAAQVGLRLPPIGAVTVHRYVLAWHPFGPSGSITFSGTCSASTVSSATTVADAGRESTNDSSPSISPAPLLSTSPRAAMRIDTWPVRMMKTCSTGCPSLIRVAPASNRSRVPAPASQATSSSVSCPRM